MFRKIVIIALLFYSVFGNSLLSNVDVTPVTPPTTIIDMDKPDDKTIESVSAFSDVITDPTDRTKIALFNYEFASRINSWENINNQQMNDVYTKAGNNFFKNTLVDKYNSLAEMIISLMQNCVGDDAHILTDKEKDDIQKHFSALAWVLVNKK
jgi:hypothetical protein